MAGSAVVAVVAATGLTGFSGRAGAAPASVTDHLVTNGSPRTTFPQNKQNEPGLALDPAAPSTLVAGSNDEIDLGPCAGSSCPFTPGVGVSGVYFSFNGGSTWTQPRYTGYSDRTGTPVRGGPIGTLPNYFEAGLASDGDAELAFGPRPNGHGGFTYDRGSRLYYANLAANFPGTSTTKGFEAVTVSHADDLAAAAAGSNAAWSAPVVESKQNGALSSDKESIFRTTPEPAPTSATCTSATSASAGRRRAAQSRSRCSSADPPTVERVSPPSRSPPRPTTARPAVDKAARCAPTATAT